MAKRETIPYGVTPKDRRSPASGERRRTSPTSKTLSGPMVAPRVPDATVVLATGAGSASPTAITQPMPAVSPEAHRVEEAPAREVSATPPRRAIPPPGPEQVQPEAPASGAAAQESSAGAYRFTAPDTERRRKRS